MAALRQWRRQRFDGLAMAVVAALALNLAACGGGSSENVRPNPPPVTPPPTVPPTTPPVVYAPDPALSKHLSVTNTAPAHAAGFTGAGVRIGVVDSGVNHLHPALQGRVVDNLVYVASPPNDLAVDDKAGHGTAVAQALAGQPFGEWPGGIAPDAEIISARIVSDAPPADDGSGQGNSIDGALGLAGIHQDLINRGARILNNSWGGVYWTNPAATSLIADEYRPFVITNNGLVVFASGNESEPNPSSIAALPSQLGTGGSRPAADLERGWLTVSAVDTDNPSQLASYSNACGIAMNYCLVAPGKVAVTGTSDAPNNPNYWEWTGTSLAAPLVSGAAALVWEAYPYFNNDLVRQAILGSATDLGATGVDPVFGHGLLNVGKAVNGPSRFDWGDVSVSFDGITSTWSNPIIGAGGLVKKGTGTLVLSGSNGYTGTTQVLGGTLRLGNANAGSFSVGPQGNLAGIGTVGGNVDNNGTVTVEGIGNLGVTGNYAQTATGRLAVDLGNWLNVAGSAQLDGELHVLGIKDGYVTQNREVVLRASGGVSGQFSSQTVAPGVFLTATRGYDATSAWLDITSISVTAVQGMNYTAASTASAARVETAMEAIDGQLAGVSPAGGTIGGNFIAAAADFQRAPTMQMAEASLKSLSGELHATADAMTYEGIDASRRVLSSRFENLGDQNLAQGGMWQQNLSSSGGMARTGFSGFDYDVDGAMYGIDQHVGRNGLFGVAVSRTRGNGWLSDSGDRSRSRQEEGQVYAGLVGDHGYLQGRLGFGRFERKVERSVLLGRRQAGVATAYTGGYEVAHAEMGWRTRLDQVQLTPYVASQFARIRNEGFRESGADGFGLMTRDSDSNRWQAIAGLRANREWRLTGGNRVGLEARAEWQQTMSAQGSAFDASFVGVEQWQTLAGIGLADSSRLFGAGLNIGLGGQSELGFDVSHRSSANLQDNQVSMRYLFGF